MRIFYYRWKVSEIRTSYICIYHSHFMYYLHITLPTLYMYIVCIYKIRNHTLNCNSLLVPNSHILVRYNKFGCMARGRQHRHKISLSLSPSDESNIHLPVTNSQIHYFYGKYIHTFYYILI